MRLISNRGNLNGINHELENTQVYIQEAINRGYDVKVDLWVHNNKLHLGTNEPTSPLDIDWLERASPRLWLHCRDTEVMSKIVELDPRGANLHYFWHENDTLTLTSRGYMLVKSGKQPVKGGIAVLPELNGDDVSTCYGVCSDYIERYK